jgi:HlyD family secretion protein
MAGGDGEANGQAAKKRRRATVKRWFSRVIMALVAAGIVAAVVVASLPKPVPVEAAAATRGPLKVTVDEDGRTRVKDRYVVSAPLLGSLARIELKPGDRVAEGGIVGRLLPISAPLMDSQSRAEAVARVAMAESAKRQAATAETRARVAYDFARKDIAAQRKMAEQGAITRQRLDLAEMDLRTKKADLASAGFGARVAGHEVEVAQAALGRLDRGEEPPRADGAPQEEELVRSPVAGVVLAVLQENAGVVQPGTPLVEIGDPQALEIVVDVLTTDAVRIPVAARTEILRWGGDEALAARVQRMEPKAFTRNSSLGVEEQRVNVILELTTPQGQWAALGDGYRVEASITVWEADDALRIPASAVFRHDGEWSVFVAEAGFARLRPVKLGQRNGMEAQVIEGLSDGEQVILHPGERVVDGVAIAAP